MSMLKKLFGGKKWNSAAEGRIDPSLGRHGRPKYGSFCMPERSDNLPLGCHGPPTSVSFSMPKRLDNPRRGHHSLPKSTSFSMSKQSDNPPLSCHGPPKSVSFSVPGRLSALKIIHAGGIAEYYYMATPAARIIDKYPSFILAKPDVFRKPWDSVVHKDEILIPGQKYYVVPQCTLKKLRRRIKKNNLSFISQSSQDSSKSQHTSIIKNKSSSDKNKARNRRVRFFGIDCKQDSSCSVLLEISKENEEADHGNYPRRNIANRNVITWQPTLTVINEK